MATLKREEVDGRAYRDLADAKASIGGFLEEVYNRQRLHSALDYLALEVFELAQRSELHNFGSHPNQSQRVMVGLRPP